jgi:hypothetical protein
MKLPGFRASASLYASTNDYRAGAFQQAGGVITLAQDSCSCTSPQCTWSCPTSIICPPGDTNCSGTCRNLNFDFYNCGSCGNRCEKNETCVNGKCRCVVPYHCCEAGKEPGTCAANQCIENRYECP